MNVRDSLLRRLRIPLFGILLVFVLGLGGYLVLGFGLIDALTNTVLVLTTVGFSPATELSTTAKVFTDVIAILGVTVYLAILALSALVVADGQFGQASRRRKMEKRVARLSDHVIVCAYGRVGRAVARELVGSDPNFVVIDRDGSLEDAMRADGVHHLIGDPTDEDVLLAAGIDRAKALVSSVDSDADGVFLTLTARALNPDLFIVARASDVRSPERLYRAGADRVVSPYVSSGRHMAHLALRPRVDDYLEIFGADDQPLRLEEVAIGAGSPLVGATLGHAFPGVTVLVLRHEDGQTVTGPPPGATLATGDLVIMLAGER